MSTARTENVSWGVRLVAAFLLLIAVVLVVAIYVLVLLGYGAVFGAVVAGAYLAFKFLVALAGV